jgi:hypothetical protein
MTRERAAIGGRIDHADNRADKGSSPRPNGPAMRSGTDQADAGR